MQSVESRYRPEMSWVELTQAWLPGISKEDADCLLWNGTCFPMGGREDVEPQLAEAATYWPDRLEEYYAKVDSEMEEAMRLGQATHQSGN